MSREGEPIRIDKKSDLKYKTKIVQIALNATVIECWECSVLINPIVALSVVIFQGDSLFKFLYESNLHVLVDLVDHVDGQPDADGGRRQREVEALQVEDRAQDDVAVHEHDEQGYARHDAHYVRLWSQCRLSRARLFSMCHINNAVKGKTEIK